MFGVWEETGALRGLNPGLKITPANSAFVSVIQATLKCFVMNVTAFSFCQEMLVESDGMPLLLPAACCKNKHKCMDTFRLVCSVSTEYTQVFVLFKRTPLHTASYSHTSVTTLFSWSCSPGGLLSLA